MLQTVLNFEILSASYYIIRNPWRESLFLRTDTRNISITNKNKIMKKDYNNIEKKQENQKSCQSSQAGHRFLVNSRIRHAITYNDDEKEHENQKSCQPSRTGRRFLVNSRIRHVIYQD